MKSAFTNQLKQINVLADYWAAFMYFICPNHPATGETWAC